MVSLCVYLYFMITSECEHFLLNIYKAFGVSSFVNSLIVCFADFFPIGIWHILKNLVQGLYIVYILIFYRFTHI